MGSRQHAHISCYLVILISLIVFPGGNIKLAAQDNGITIHQDRKIDDLMDLYKRQEQAIDKVPGFRIQILAGTSRDKAYGAETAFRMEFPQYKSYLTYTSPYFKIRVGDFTDKLSAYRALQHIKSKYPASFLVAEDVSVK